MRLLIKQLVILQAHCFVRLQQKTLQTSVASPCLYAAQREVYASNLFRILQQIVASDIFENSVLGEARGKNVSGDPVHQHQYITVGVNTPSSTR